MKTLFNYLHEGKVTTGKQALCIAEDMATLLQEVHSSNFFFDDLAPGTVIIEEFQVRTHLFH